ncbi:MAG TPA: hypothetical protein VFR60_05620, partial [Sphingomicrobium sp.]|nr:hypothetical protein [Sphingomicrobium sp.]
MKQFASLLLASTLVAAPIFGQSAHQHSSATRPAQAFDGLGEIDFPNSGKPEAQADFIRGVKLLHNFQYEDAIVAFQAAQKIDPDFALAYWGEAMSHNYSLWAEQQYDMAKAVLAKLGATPAERAGKAKTQREKAYMAAVEALYGEGTKFERDIAFAEEM